MEKEILVISDIHGRGKEFKMLIRRILKYIDRYRIILLGDYIGYGKENLEVIRCLKYLQEHSDCIILKGNWEDMFYNYVRNNKCESSAIYKEAFIHRGGVNTANEIFEDRAALNYFLNLIDKMKTSHMEIINGEQYIFAHSGIELLKENPYDCNNILKQQTEENLIWNFNFYNNLLDDEYLEIIEEIPYSIVAGHVPIQNLLENEYNKNVYQFLSVIGVDFGASKSNGDLGMVNLSKKDFPCIIENIKKK